MNKINKMALHAPTLFQELMLFLTSTPELLETPAPYLQLEVTGKDVIFVRVCCGNKRIISPSLKGRNS